jgi:hypothetical protein
MIKRTTYDINESFANGGFSSSQANFCDTTFYEKGSETEYFFIGEDIFTVDPC